MKTSTILLASAALFATACDTEKGATTADKGPEVTAAPVAAPNNGDWSTIVTRTPEGGFLMGNPTAKVKLIEFGSMTCGHCASFEEEGGKPLVENYVKKGLVSWEFRNYVREQLDMTASLVARCGGEANFFGMTRTLFHDQSNWVGKIQAADQARLQALETMTPAQRFSTIAELAGLKQFAAQRGVPRAKAEQCLGNQSEIDRLVQMNTDTVTQYPSFRGTPGFVINGAFVEETSTWEALEPKIKESLAS